VENFDPYHFLQLVWPKTNPTRNTYAIAKSQCITGRAFLRSELLST